LSGFRPGLCECSLFGIQTWLGGKSFIYGLLIFPAINFHL
jgi:hypothetical protein